MVEDGVDGAQEDVAKNVEVLVATGLDATVAGAITEVLEREILRVNDELLAADRKRDLRERGTRVRGREDVALLLGTLLTAESLVHGLADLVADEAKGGAGVGDGLVAGAVDSLAVDGRALGVEL